MRRFAGTAVLASLALRTDRVRIALWVVLVSVASYLLARGGSSTHLTERVADVTMLTVAVMSVLLVTPNLRGAEQSGRTELARTGVVGRFAPLTAGLCSALAANAAVCALLQIAFVSAGFSAAGSLVVAVGVLVTGLVFTAMSALASQIFDTTRAANAAAVAVVVITYLLHVLGEALHEGDRSLVGWLSPFTWAHAAHAFGETRWWPLALGLAVAVVLLAVACWSATRRDHGFGIDLTRRAESSDVPDESGGMPRFVLEQLRWPLFVWCPVVAGIGLATGGFGAAVPGFSTTERPPEEVFAQWLVLLAVLACAYSISTVGVIVDDEAAGRADAVLSGPLSRAKWFVAQSIVFAGGALAVLLVGGIALSATAAIALGELGTLWHLLTAMVSLVPPLIAVVGAAAWCYGHAPRALSALWGWLGYIAVIALGSDVLPAWAGLLSPFARSTPPPLADYSPGTAILLLAIGVVLTVLGAEGFRRRDIAPVTARSR